MHEGRGTRNGFFTFYELYWLGIDHIQRVTGKSIWTIDPILHAFGTSSEFENATTRKKPYKRSIVGVICSGATTSIDGCGDGG
jgi:hypothetical protein